jgi:hypothetical protein
MDWMLKREVNVALTGLDEAKVGEISDRSDE